MKINYTQTYNKLVNKARTNNPVEIIGHHTGGTDANPLADTSHHTAQIIEQWHLQKGWEGFGYTYAIHKDGTIWAGRPEHYHCAATVGKNSSSINIVLCGNFDRKLTTENALPTKEQEESFKWLYLDIIKRYPNITPDKIKPHRAYAKKTCWGNNLKDDYMQKLAEKAIYESQPEIKDTEVEKVVELQIKESQIKPMNEFLNGKKTYIGIITTLLGTLGLSKFISDTELSQIIDLVLQLVGLAISTYGRYKANK